MASVVIVWGVPGAKMLARRVLAGGGGLAEGVLAEGVLARGCSLPERVPGLLNLRLLVDLMFNLNLPFRYALPGGCASQLPRGVSRIYLLSISLWA